MKLFPLGIVILLLAISGVFSLNVSAADQSADFKMTPIEAMPGEEFSTTIYIDANSGLREFQMQLLYDPSVVRLVNKSQSANLSGTMSITSGANGILKITYSRTNSNLTEKTNLIDLTFAVDENAGPDVYELLKLDPDFETKAFTSAGSSIQALTFKTEFQPLKLYQMGDVNLDGDVDSKDVTDLRQHLAWIGELQPYQLRLADAFYDGDISISDAAYIQQYTVNHDIILGNRVNITFYDQDKRKLFVKSVTYGDSLVNVPAPPVIGDHSSGRWSYSPDRDEAANFDNLEAHTSVYARYDRETSAMSYYKQRLTERYYTSNVLSGDLVLVEELPPYQSSETVNISWASSNWATLNNTTGVFSKPTYDSVVTLTATIEIRRNGYIDEIGTIDFEYNVTGVFQCPSLQEIRQYLNGFIGDKISANIALPRKVSNDDVKNDDKKYEVRVSWAVIAEDGSEQGITQISRTAYEQNVTLVATVTFNGVPVETDGKIYFDDVVLTPVTVKEVRDYIIDQIASYQGPSLTTNEILWNYDTKYNAHVRWISKNTTIATIADNIVTIKDFAVNGSALPMIAEVTYPSGVGSITFELQYTVSIVNANRLLEPGVNIDEELYKALRSATGSGGTLTTDALKNPKFVYLDLSGYPEIKDLTGLTYCTNLRVLNISGLRITRGLNEIASLSKLEALMARDCGFGDDSLTDGGIPILKNMIYLELLDLSYNNFTNLDSLFEEDRRYGRLLEVYLNNNQLTDISALKRAPLIRFMILSDNLLDSDDLADFKDFKLLKLLSLANNNITSLENIKNNRTLLELRLQGNQISDVRDLRLMTALQALYLGNNKLKNVFAGSQEGNISYLKYLTELEILYLNDNDIEDVDYLETLTKLVALNVSGNRIQTLGFLSRRGATMTELYAENNEIQTFSFVKDLTKLRKLMLSDNSSIYESALPGLLSGLTKLETLTLSGKDLRTLSFLSGMSKLVRLDVADCNLASYLVGGGSITDQTLAVTSYTDNVAYIRGLASTLKFLDVSGNGLAYDAADMRAYMEKNKDAVGFPKINSSNFTQINFNGQAPTRFSSLYELVNLIVLYADNLTGSLNAPNLFSLMSEIRYVSLENCGITDVSWLSKFRNLVYVDLAGNSLSTFDLGGYISLRSRGTLLYLYIDSQTPFTFMNSYTSFDDNVLRELSMANVQLGEVDYLPDMENLEYLNISHSDVENLRGSQPDFYEIFSLDRFKALKTIDVSYVQAEISVLEELPNLEAVYAIGTASDKSFYESNVHTLYALHNKGVDCWLYDYTNRYKPIAVVEGAEILGEIEDLNRDLTVAAGNMFSDNNPFIPSEINDFAITWTLSNPINYAIIDNKLSVRDYANIADEALILTAGIAVYPDQAPVSRTFTINTHILRADTKYLDIDSTGVGDFMARGAEFTYDVRTKAAETDGFSSPAAPVHDGIDYSYSAVLQNGNATLTNTILIEKDNHQYQIHPVTAALESTVTINVNIGHNEASGYVIDKTVSQSMLIKTRTFTIQYEANGGVITNKADGATVTVKSYLEDMLLFDDITVSRDGYNFGGWYTDAGLSNPFTQTLMPSQNISLYAKWIVNTYAVSFVSNGGSDVAPVYVEYGKPIPKPVDPVRDKYLFLGWYKDSGFEKKWDFNADTVQGETVLYANWQLNEYNVTFNANGGKVDGASTKTVKVMYGALVTPPAASRDYYTFGGWYKDSKCTQAWNLSSDKVTGDVTLYAKWTQKPVSAWVAASSLPSGAQVVARKWTYTLTSYTESKETSMSGWTQYESYWQRSGSESTRFYYASFPSGFDTGHQYYKDFHKSQNSPYSAYENATNKRTVSTWWEGWIYWHWMYNTNYANAILRIIAPAYGYSSNHNSYLYQYFGAYTSSTNYPRNGSYLYNGLPYYLWDRGAWSESQGSTAWFRFDYYTGLYDDYYKIFKYRKAESKESETNPSSLANVSNVKELIQYREK
ncbi:MAG: InlB B-repeat-containing protein [Clostridiales Family XIII bacterium]|jgi:uncharacterized repeat protein (TIGR02543 family)|nr:InlB B-repeat-containing protein [Clostridiales Family XIII bacterium]